MTTKSGNLQLKLGVKLGYGVGSLGMACITNAVVSYLLYFYTDIVILPPLLVGLALTIPRFWDAISDPLMGLISDRTKTSSGRRRPYIFWGTPLLVLSFVLLWYPFGSGSNTIIFSYLLIANLLFTTAITIVGVPYISLGGELTPHYHERTTIFAYNLAFGMIGGLIGMAMKLFSDLLHFQNKQMSFMVIAACFAIPSGIFLLLTYFTTKETVSVEETSSKKSFIKILKTSFQNKSFRNLAIAMIIVNSGTTLAVQFLPFMLKYWVKLEHLLFPAYAVYTLAVYLGFPVWKKVGEKYDKKHVLAAAFLCAAVFYGMSFFMFKPGAVVMLFVWAVLVGFCGAGGLLFPFSMIADIADEDELETGFRSEGVFYGINSFILKLSLAVGSMIGALALWLAGFHGGEIQSSASIMIFRITYVIPFITFLFSAVIIYRGYTLTEEKANKNKLALKNIREGN
ncbi:MFS transporter [bacterium]|nr:MFS transporter [bacterium]